jgi:hypothetical protein
VLAVEELAIAGSALERGEPSRASAPALGAATTIQCGDRRRRAEQASEEERPYALASPLAVHA